MNHRKREFKWKYYTQQSLLGTAIVERASCDCDVESPSNSPDAAAVDALDEVLGEKRGEVALDAAAVRPPDIALPVAQVARRGEHAPQPSNLWDSSPRVWVGRQSKTRT